VLREHNNVAPSNPGNEVPVDPSRDSDVISDPDNRIVEEGLRHLRVLKWSLPIRKSRIRLKQLSPV
jgi:hypothetical protein